MIAARPLPPVDEGGASQEEAGRDSVEGHPPLPSDTDKEEPLHDLGLVVAGLPVVVSRLLLGYQKGQTRGVPRHVTSVATGKPKSE